MLLAIIFSTGLWYRAAFYLGFLSTPFSASSSKLARIRWRRAPHRDGHRRAHRPTPGGGTPDPQAFRQGFVSRTARRVRARRDARRRRHHLPPTSPGPRRTARWPRSMVSDRLETAPAPRARQERPLKRMMPPGLFDYRDSELLRPCAHTVSLSSRVQLPWACPS